jgi:hypothetical protein
MSVLQQSMLLLNIFILRQSVPEILDPVFAKTSPKRSFSMTEYERFGLVFTKTRVYKFGHWAASVSVLQTMLPGCVIPTAACAAIGLVWVSGGLCCMPLEMYSMCCLWTCLYYISLSCLWTCLSNSCICCLCTFS